VLALGGGSWPTFDSDASWVPMFRERGVSIVPLSPANCGFDVGWSDHFRTKFAGHPVRSVSVSLVMPDGTRVSQRGDCVVTDTGLEGGAICALSAHLRDQ
jgi:predicted flavoprotein YhiN